PGAFAVSEISSNAKSLPMSARLVSMMLMVTEVLAPEFQVVLNCCQIATVEGAPGVPTETPLNRMSNVAGEPANQLDNQIEKSYFVLGATDTVSAQTITLP